MSENRGVNTIEKPEDEKVRSPLKDGNQVSAYCMTIKYICNERDGEKSKTETTKVEQGVQTEVTPEDLTAGVTIAAYIGGLNAKRGQEINKAEFSKQVTNGHKKPGTKKKSENNDIKDIEK